MKKTNIKKGLAVSLTIIAATIWGFIGIKKYTPSAETKPAHAAVMANISDIPSDADADVDTDEEEINNPLISPATEVGDVDTDVENIVEDKEDAHSASTPQVTTPATTTVSPDEAKEENQMMTTEVVEKIIPFTFTEEDEIVAPVILPDPAVITYQSTVKLQYVDGSAATADVWIDGVLVTVEGEVSYDYQLITVSSDSSVNEEILSSTDGFVVYTTYILTIKNPEPVVTEEDPAPTDDQDQNQDENKEDTSIDEHTTTDATFDEVKPEDSTPEQTETVEQTDKDEDKVEIIADPVEDEDITNDETTQPTVESEEEPEIGPAITYNEYTYTDEYNGYTYTVVVGTTTTTDGQTTTETTTETVLEFGIQISESSVTIGSESGLGYAWENYDQLYQAIDAIMTPIQ